MTSTPVPASVLSGFWYYSVELAPGVMTPGRMPPTTPLLPRIIMRRADLRGATCLDVGTMEGLLPVLMCRQGAESVVALDANDHCYEKLKAVRAAYQVSVSLRTVGLMYDLAKRGGPQESYDLINASGLLYHVFSPIHVLAGLRPMLKKGGLMIVSTNMVARNDYTMEFNHEGRFQPELNTFWYIAPPALESMLRYLKLKPIDALYLPMGGASRANAEGTSTGYMSVVCRAVDDDSASGEWAAKSRRRSWEYIGLGAPEMLSAQPPSTIAYANEAPGWGLDLFEATRDPARQIGPATDPRDTHVLRLTDTV